MNENNKFGIRGAAIADAIANRCFTPEQKEILEYQQGTVKITIVDQLNRFYGHRYLIWGDEKTVRIAAQIVHENEYLIEEIKELKEKIKIIKNPENFKRVITAKTASVGCANSLTNIDNLNRQIDTSEGYSQSNNVTYQRSMMAEPTRIIDKLDALDDTNKLTTVKQKKSKFKFVDDAMNKETLLKGASDEIEIKEVVPESDNKEYHNSAFSKTGNLAYSSNDVHLEHRAVNKNETTNKAISTTNNEGTTEDQILSEATYRSLIIEIPRLRVKFWNKFWCLFKPDSHC